MIKVDGHWVEPLVTYVKVNGHWKPVISITVKQPTTGWTDTDFVGPPPTPAFTYKGVGTTDMGKFQIHGYTKALTYTPVRISGSGTATVDIETGEVTLSDANARFSFTCRYGPGLEVSAPGYVERLAPSVTFVATGPYTCYGNGAGCVNNHCGCGTYHEAGAFPYSGWWACCSTGYNSWVNYGPAYTWGGSDFNNGQGEWFKVA